ncbi:MAG: hypothetical protein ONB42_17715 [candidate division KSB1 bacterium]|nr:hypothetical protein [candidate division KSB1 bacterium]
MLVKDGKWQRLARCELNFISRWLIDASSRYSNYRMMEAFWVEAGKQ